MFNWGGKGNESEKDSGASSSTSPAPSSAPKAPLKPPTPPEKVNKSDAKSVHGFDPTALERAAKAAKDLDKSKNSREALKIIESQEVTKQKEYEMERAKFAAMQQELALNRVKAEEEAGARTLEKQTQHERARADYKDELDRKRMRDQLNAQRQLQEEERQRTEESLRRQEEIRRKTLEYEAELRQSTETAKAKAEAEGRTMQERRNHDLTLATKSLEANEYRKTVMDGISLAGTTLGNGLNDFFTDKDKLTNAGVLVLGVVGGRYVLKTSIGITGRYIESRIGKPSLVRETTRANVLEIATNPVQAFKLGYFSLFSKSGADVMKNIVLESNIESRLKRIAISTANTKKNNAPFRHLLLHGPPGTGKTMFAKSLAKESGMHYAIMTGGDVAPLGQAAVTEIHKLFDWANTTNKGVILFVDEADAFLRKRSTEKISEDMRNSLNAFLYRTGEASHKFMIIYASNQPEQFDWAINDRIDEMVEFQLPGLEERLRMITQYVDTYLLNPPKESRKIIVTDVDEELLRSVAAQTAGYSGREISKLAIAWQAAAYGKANASIDAELMLQVLGESKVTKSQKQSWLSKEEIEHLTKNRTA